MTQAQTTQQATPQGATAGSAGIGPARSIGHEAPDIMFVLRHHLWLIVVGTVAGLLVGGVSFLACRKWMPQYSVFRQYQVMPAQSPNPMTPTPDQPLLVDEIARFIQRQKLLAQDPEVLQAALESKQFQEDYRDPSQQSRWLREHAKAPEVYLRKQLRVEPVPNSDVFRLGMSGPDPKELKGLVEALSGAYYGYLRVTDKRERVGRADRLLEEKKTLEVEIAKKETELDTFRQNFNISAMVRAADVKAAALGNLLAELAKLDANVSAAMSQLGMLQQQARDGTLAVSQMVQQEADFDPQVRQLEMQRFALEQDKMVLLQRFGPLHSQVIALDTRMSEIDRQRDKIRQERLNEARTRMLEQARNVVDQLDAQRTDLLKRKEGEERELRDLDQYLVKYKSLDSALTDLRDVYRKLSEQVTVAQMKTRQDVERVVQLGGELREPSPDDITFPQLKIFLPLGFAAGLLLSFGLAYLLELTNTRVRTPRDVTKTMQMPLLGYVPDQEDDSFVDGNLATSVLSAPGSMIAESFRLIRGRLAATAHTHPLYSLLVASIEPGGGATTVACNLATSMALNDLRVLLVDGNFYRPGLKDSFKDLPALGLSDVLSGEATVAQTAVAQAELPRLHVMSAGSKAASTASELLAAKAFRDLLAEARNHYDLVIVDGAPMNLVSDSITVAGRVDGVVAVVRAGATKRGTVARVREQLRQVHATLLGLVLNAAQVQTAGYFKENYRTFYQYAAPKAGAAAVVPAAPVAVN